MKKIFLVICLVGILLSSSVFPALAAADQVTVAWWHIQTETEHRDLWQELANQYMAMHPNVKIEITVMENENFKAKLTTVMQSGEVPDLFQSWGGGTMNEQAEAGLLKDITNY
ncbi:MAG: extracellular solute-binding protein, partial [Atribacterota bacterium]|nr:extracellular solute-binding protein [Atribacterota bacterium]